MVIRSSVELRSVPYKTRGPLKYITNLNVSIYHFCISCNLDLPKSVAVLSG